MDWFPQYTFSSQYKVLLVPFCLVSKGCVHCGINQCSQITGRSSPNVGIYPWSASSLPGRSSWKMSSDTFNSYPMPSRLTHAEWEEPDSVTGHTDSPTPVSGQYLSKSEPASPVETIIEESALLPMCLCLCPWNDSYENSSSTGLVLSLRKKKQLQLLSYPFGSFLTYLEVNGYGISKAEEAFFGLQSPTFPKGKRLLILRQQENN